MHSIFLMRNIRSIFLCITVTIAAGCENSPTELLLVKPGSPIDSAIAQDIVGLVGNDAAVSIHITDLAQSDASALDALTSGAADIALVSNNMPYRSGVSTVIPLYPTVLHIGYFGEREFEFGTDIFRGARVFAGPEGSASRRHKFRQE